MNLFVKMSFEDIAASRKSRQMYSQLGYGLLLRGRPPKLDKNKLYKSDNYTQTRETKKKNLAMTSINSAAALSWDRQVQADV